MFLHGVHQDFLPPSPNRDCVCSCLSEAYVPDKTATTMSALPELHNLLGSSQLWSKCCEVERKEQRKSPLPTARGKGELSIAGQPSSTRAHYRDLEGRDRGQRPYAAIGNNDGAGVFQILKHFSFNARSISIPAVYDNIEVGSVD